MTSLLLFLLLAQGPPQPQQREAPAPNVSFERILKANQEPQNWLTYSGTTMSQRPPSFSPHTGLFYIPTWENSSTTYIKGEEPPEFHEGQSFSGLFPKPGARGDDVYSAVRAIDPKTGEKKWDFRQPVPATEAGILTTASDVLFSGSRDGTFYALDARDGKLLWQTNLGPSVAAGPMSFSVNGKQYVSIVVGNSLFTFGFRD